jgi:hypothetical protein
MKRTGFMTSLGIGFVLAAAVAAAQPAGGGPPPAPSQDARIVSLTAAVAQDRDALWILDRETHKLAVYRIDNAGLTVVAVRDVKADFRCLEYSGEGRKQSPPVLQMKKAADAAAAAAAKPAAPGAPPPPGLDLTPQPIASLLMVHGAYEPGRGVVHVIDSTNRKLATYTTDGRSLTLLHVRDLRADLQPVEYTGGPPQSPTVADMTKATKP